MAAFGKSRFIWMNGRLVAWDDATVHVTAHGLHYGTGVFEGMRAYETPAGPAIFRLDEHLRRMVASAEAYEMTLPFPVEALAEASAEVVRANGLTNAYLRPIAFYDSHSFAVWPQGCPVSVAIIAVPGRQYIAGGVDKGATVMLSSVRRIDSSSLPPWVKACGHYTNSVRAVQQAIRGGFDDAILLNAKGDVAEGSGANLFVVRDGVVVTNDRDASIVMGITRDSVITIARDLGLAVEIRPFTTGDLAAADELFFSGTAVEVTPITRLDDRAIGSGAPGPVTRRIQQTYFDTVHGKVPRYESWLTPVGPAVPA
ncbi:MAG TPA: branched-chain amino acid transaminase [Gemmatimonadaceae bacterium]|nr:branched-chain amino acid transaminase [Gemmatimonadaceae bacterium]